MKTELHINQSVSVTRGSDSGRPSRDKNGKGRRSATPTSSRAPVVSRGRGVERLRRGLPDLTSVSVLALRVKSLGVNPRLPFLLPLVVQPSVRGVIDS